MIELWEKSGIIHAIYLVILFISGYFIWTKHFVLGFIIWFVFTELPILAFALLSHVEGSSIEYILEAALSNATIILSIFFIRIVFYL